MPRHKKDDRSVFEISNDRGDHWVADVPTSAARQITKDLMSAGCQHDQDEDLKRSALAEQRWDARDHDQYRFRSERVIDEGEDLEDSYDQEDDRSDWEYSHQRPVS